MSELERALQAYDGRAITLLSEVRARFGDDPPFLRELAILIGSPDGFISDGASWLIKTCAEDGISLDAQVVATLLEKLNAVSSWQTALHICQSVQHLALTAEQAHHLANWLTGYLDHKRPFLRAWSMDALQHLAADTPGLSPLAQSALNRAATDGAASVRARARRYRKA